MAHPFQANEVLADFLELLCLTGVQQAQCNRYRAEDWDLEADVEMHVRGGMPAKSLVNTTDVRDGLKWGWFARPPCESNTLRKPLPSVRI